MSYEINISHTNAILRAVAFAVKAHGDQRRVCTPEPYVMHPIRVAQKVSNFGGSLEQVQAALLHDVLEDTDVTPIQLRHQFHDGVTSLVEALTDKITPEEYPDINRATRKRLELELLQAQPAEVHLIKACDLIDNLTDVENLDAAFVNLYVTECAATAAALVHLNNVIATRLNATIEAAKKRLGL